MLTIVFLNVVYFLQFHNLLVSSSNSGVGFKAALRCFRDHSVKCQGKSLLQVAASGRGYHCKCVTRVTAPTTDTTEDPCHTTYSFLDQVQTRWSITQTKLRKENTVPPMNKRVCDRKFGDGVQSKSQRQTKAKTVLRLLEKPGSTSTNSKLKCSSPRTSNPGTIQECSQAANTFRYAFFKSSGKERKNDGRASMMSEVIYRLMAMTAEMDDHNVGTEANENVKQPWISTSPANMAADNSKFDSVDAEMPLSIEKTSTDGVERNDEGSHEFASKSKTRSSFRVRSRPRNTVENGFSAFLKAKRNGRTNWAVETLLNTPLIPW